MEDCGGMVVLDLEPLGGVPRPDQKMEII